jgi:hypothetical protein
MITEGTSTSKVKRKIDVDGDGLTLVGDLFTPEDFDENGHSAAATFNSTSDNAVTWAVFTPAAPTAVPEPATLTLLRLGSVGLGGYRRRQRR